MSAHVVTEFHAQPGRGADVEQLLIEILGDSLQCEGCEAVRIVRDQDDPDHVAGFTQWAERRNLRSWSRRPGRWVAPWPQVAPCLSPAGSAPPSPPSP